MGLGHHGGNLLAGPTFTQIGGEHCSYHHTPLDPNLSSPTPERRMVEQFTVIGGATNLMRIFMRAGVLVALVSLAACSSHPKEAQQTETLVIEDHFMTCVDQDLHTWPIGASTCPNGWRDGGVCLFPNGKKEFVDDTEAAVQSCEKRGGQLHWD
jgi:hypothetical protein